MIAADRPYMAHVTGHMWVGPSPSVGGCTTLATSAGAGRLIGFCKHVPRYLVDFLLLTGDTVCQFSLHVALSSACASLYGALEHGIASMPSQTLSTAHMFPRMNTRHTSQA
jgi:hypothetical protein